jgi:hypothetical protein
LNPDTFNWDRINQTGLTTSEFSRAWLASVITFFDLAIVIADWEFPWFENEMAIKLPGMNITDIHWQCLDRLPEWFSVFVSGKWFNYGIICIVMMLDFNMYKNQVLYIPSDYMQYVDPDGFVWTVEDTLEIDLIREDPSLLSWEARNGRVFDGLQDVVSNSQYLEYGFIAMLSSFIPIVFGLGLFVYLIHKDAALDREGETPMKHRLVVDEEEEAAKQASRAAVAEAKQKRDLEEAQEVEAAVAQKQRLREQQKLSSVKVTPL